MPRYLWKPGTPINLEAQMVGETLESIRTLHGGALEPQAVVDASRPAGAPLHSYFVWDDAVAAERYRKDQAGGLIRCLTVEVQRGQGLAPVETRAFVSVRDSDEARSYTSVSVAMNDPELRKQVVQAALRELKVWRRQYAEYKELAEVFAAVDSLDKAA